MTALIDLETSADFENDSQQNRFLRTRLPAPTLSASFAYRLPFVQENFIIYFPQA